MKSSGNRQELSEKKFGDWANHRWNGLKHNFGLSRRVDIGVCPISEEVLEEASKSGDSSLHDWFSKSKSSDGKPGWVQLGGKYKGKRFVPDNLVRPRNQSVVPPR